MSQNPAPHSNTPTGPPSGPLQGIRVLEFGSFVAGPWAGQLLADMGADVIKVEPPSGDPWRHASPFAPNESRVFTPLNRGVRSICLDLKQESGQSMLKSLPLERLYRDSRCGSLMLPLTAELCLVRLGTEALYEPGESDE